MAKSTERIKHVKAMKAEQKTLFYGWNQAISRQPENKIVK